MVVVMNRTVLFSRPTGSARKSEYWPTPAMASGCSDWSMRAANPPVSIPVACPCTRRTGSAGVIPNSPGSPGGAAYRSSLRSPPCGAAVSSAAIRSRTPTNASRPPASMSVAESIEPPGGTGSSAHGVQCSQRENSRS